MPKQPQTTGRLIETAQRRRFVLDLRKSGLTYAEIADAAIVELGSDRLPKGWDERYAWKDVRRELDKLREDIGETAGRVRQMEIERLNDLLLALWDKAHEVGDYDAIDRVLKIMKRRAALMGLDAPTKQEITGEGGGPVVVAIGGIDPDEDI